MKDIIEFPVVGTKFIDGGHITAHCLKERTILSLEAEPSNPIDPNAIKVLAFGDEHFGYVPNKGMSCSNCWSHVYKEEQFCPKCNTNWEGFVVGGLATRILMSGALKNYVCFVSRIDPESYNTITAKLIIE